jgi:osmotically-inducible protein OsmY
VKVDQAKHPFYRFNKEEQQPMKASRLIISSAAACCLVAFSAMAGDTPAKNADTAEQKEVTPFDQGNSKADLDTTARIRKEIMADQSLSVNAHNVKVITNEGKVTLRGLVNTAEEKRIIGEIAVRYARPGSVENMLEVKPVTDNAQKG